MKNILVLGGTGAMGKPLVDLLSKEHKVFVTTRSAKDSKNNVEYLVGNAKDNIFLHQVLSMYKWDAVVDFMVRSEINLKENLPYFFENTHQYIFISSCRVIFSIRTKNNREYTSIIRCFYRCRISKNQRIRFS